MKRHRKWLSWLLGAMLLLQGFAVAAAPIGAGTEPAQQMASDGNDTLPCHGQMAEPEQAGQSCCDAQCPDMSSCMLAHLAPAPALAALSFDASIDHLAPAPVAVILHQPPSLLRPPILLHG